MKKLIFGCIMLSLICLGCKTTADQEDGQRPSYRISFLDAQGNIVGVFDSDEPSSNVMLLKAGERFNMFYITRDPGGIQKARLTYPIAMNVIEPMTDDEDPPRSWVDVSSPLSSNKEFEYTGDPLNRYNGAAYGIVFNSQNAGESHIILVRSEDYGSGGISTDGLIRSAQITIRYTTNTTGVE